MDSIGIVDTFLEIFSIFCILVLELVLVILGYRFSFNLMRVVKEVVMSTLCRQDFPYVEDDKASGLTVSAFD